MKRAQNKVKRNEPCFSLFITFISFTCVVPLFIPFPALTNYEREGHKRNERVGRASEINNESSNRSKISEQMKNLLIKNEC